MEGTELKFDVMKIPLRIIGLILTVIVTLTSTTCEEPSPLYMTLANNTGNAIFAYPAYFYGDIYDTTILPPEKKFFAEALKIEAKESRQIRSDLFSLEAAIIVIEIPVLRKYTWEEIRERQLYTVLQCTVEEAYSGYVMEYNGMQIVDNGGDSYNQQ